MVSLAVRKSAITVSDCNVSIASESTERVSGLCVYEASESTFSESILVESVWLISASESAKLRIFADLCRSIPKDWTAARSTIRVGTHIFAIKFFITRRQRYE